MDLKRSTEEVTLTMTPKEWESLRAGIDGAFGLLVQAFRGRTTPLETKDDDREVGWAARSVEALSRRVARLEEGLKHVTTKTENWVDHGEKIESLNGHLERMSENFTLQLDEHKKMIGLYAEATERMRVDFDQRVSALEGYPHKPEVGNTNSTLRTPTLREWGQAQTALREAEERVRAILGQMGWHSNSPALKKVISALQGKGSETPN